MSSLVTVSFLRGCVRRADDLTEAITFREMRGKPQTGQPWKQGFLVGCQAPQGKGRISTFRERTSFQTSGQRKEGFSLLWTEYLAFLNFTLDCEPHWKFDCLRGLVGSPRVHLVTEHPLTFFKCLRGCTVSTCVCVCVFFLSSAYRNHI